MAFLTKPSWLARLRSTPLPPFAPAPRDLNPRLATVARPARAVSPNTRLGAVAEMLRVSPYRTVAVVEEQRLIGMASERDVLRALLDADDEAGRARVRELPIRSVMTPHPEGTRAWATPATRVSEAAVLLDQADVDALPVVDAQASYLGLVARSDLVQDLVRPFRPPTVGGMATPLGVYLTTGAVSGGAGTGALVLTGLMMFVIQLLAQSVGWAGHARLVAAFGGVFAFPTAWASVLSNVIPFVMQSALLLLLLRLSPLAGYHAAEHQVVHALERAEPLLVEAVRRMPRVHPRCGTNLVAGMLLLTLSGLILYPFADHLGRGLPVGVVLSLMLALAYWRTLGTWLQQHLTTRPATDAQIESGIRAARQLLEQHDRAPYAPTRPTSRLWRMGFLQILSGFALGYAVLHGIVFLVPSLRGALDAMGALL